MCCMWLELHDYVRMSSKCLFFAVHVKSSLVAPAHPGTEYLMDSYAVGRVYVINQAGDVGTVKLEICLQSDTDSWRSIHKRVVKRLAAHQSPESTDTVTPQICMFQVCLHCGEFCTARRTVHLAIAILRLMRSNGRGVPVSSTSRNRAINSRYHLQDFYPENLIVAWCIAA